MTSEPSLDLHGAGCTLSVHTQSEGLNGARLSIAAEVLMRQQWQDAGWQKVCLALNLRCPCLCSYTGDDSRAQMQTLSYFQSVTGSNKYGW